jgi:hypothetical protein
MVKRRPLEATLMMQFDLDFHEAREIAEKGRENLGLSADGSSRLDELTAECLRLAQEDVDRKRAIPDVHFDPHASSAAKPQYTEIFFDPTVLSTPTPASPTVETKPSRASPTSVAQTKKEFDYGDYKADYFDLDASDDDEYALRRSSDPVNVYLTPKPIRATLSKFRRRADEHKSSGSTDSDDLSFLVEPLGADESLQDTSAWEKETREKETSSFQLEPRPRRDSTPRPAPKPMPVPAALLTAHKSPESCHKTSDATHATEASTVDSGIPTIIYCFHRADDDDDGDDEVGSFGSPTKTPKDSSPQKSKKKSLTRFTSGALTPHSASTGKRSVGRSKSHLEKRENFERLFVDL